MVLIKPPARRRIHTSRRTDELSSAFDVQQSIGVPDRPRFDQIDPMAKQRRQRRFQTDELIPRVERASPVELSQKVDIAAGGIEIRRSRGRLEDFQLPNAVLATERGNLGSLGGDRPVHGVTSSGWR